MSKIKSSHPDWALSFRTPGTELRNIRGNYYLYSYKTKYDAITKKPKKVTGNLLGSIIEPGVFKPSPKRTLESSLEKISQATTHQSGKVFCKEYGIPFLISTSLELYIKRLQQCFGEEWKNILAVAYCRFVYRCPLKSIPFRVASSYLPELFHIEPFSSRQASKTLNWLGQQKEMRLKYMKSFIASDDYILMDSTNILSHSNLIGAAQVGYSHTHHFDSQFNLMYLYSATTHLPVYYRLVPGNIREVKAFKNSLLEAGLQNAVVIADKGFYSQANIDLLLHEHLSFIIPLKRDNKIIFYDEIKQNVFKTNDSFFKHEKRIIWFRQFTLNDQTTLYLFLDEKLRVKEEIDYLFRIKTHPETHQIDQFHTKKDHFGTIALLSNLKDNPQQIYLSYKSRMDIELLFDGMKNVLQADHTYMQNEVTLEGWMFVNHLCLQWYQHLSQVLKSKDLLKRISVNDYIQILTDIKKVSINGSWHLNEFTKETKKLLEVMGHTLI